MLRGLAQVGLGIVGALLVTCGSAVASTVPSQGYFNSNGLYDCQVFEPVIGFGGSWNYVNTYKFNSNGTYAEAGARVGKQLQPPVTTGRYHLSGSKIIPSSGILKASGDYMLIATNYLHVAKDNGHLSGLNCIRIYPPPPVPPKVTVVATFTCLNTVQGLDPLQPTAYNSQVVTSTLTFFSDGTYQPNGLTTKGNWHASSGKIVFTSGPYWHDGLFAQHNVGIVHSPGVAMPHAAYPFDPSTLYTLVIKDTRQEGGVPPSQEFVTTDGPNGSYSQPESFYYCNKS